MLRLTKLGWRSLLSSIGLLWPAVVALPSVASPDPAELLPPNTAYTILLDMRQETWAQLDQYALFQQLQAQGIGAPSPGTLPLIPELTYESEVAPWVGETVAIALLPVNDPVDAVLARNEVMIAPIADPAAFATVFEDDLPGAIAALKQRDPELQTDAGVDIYYWSPLFAPESDGVSPTLPPESAPPEALPLPPSESKHDISTSPLKHCQKSRTTVTRSLYGHLRR